MNLRQQKTVTFLGMDWLPLGTREQLNRTLSRFRHLRVNRRSAVVILLGPLIWWMGIVMLERAGFAATTGLGIHLVYGISLSLLFGWLLLPHQRFRLAPAANDMIIRGMKDAVFVLDAHNEIVVANPAAAQLLAATPNDLIGQPLQRFSPDWAAHVAEYQQTQEVSNEIFLQKGQTLLHYDVRIAPLRSYWGSMNGRVVIVRDITARRVATQQAAQLILEQEKVKLLRDFIDTTSHDLNTPLTTLRISTDLLLVYVNRLQTTMTKLRLLNGSSASPAQLTELDQLIQSVSTNGNRVNGSTLRLQGLVSDMLELVRLDKQLSLELVEQDMNDLSCQVIADSDSSAAEKNITLSYEPDVSLPLIPLDSTYLKLAFHHLIRNAVTYTPAEGKITFRTFREADWVVAEVNDTGSGIPATELPYIFDRYYRVDKSRSTNTGGMGLGLAIAKKIVEAHQGEIQVESTVGQGSSFRVRLPIRTEQDPAPWRADSCLFVLEQPTTLQRLCRQSLLTPGEPQKRLEHPR